MPVTFFRPANAALPIVLTPVPRFIVPSKPVQLKNTLFPIVSTEFGITKFPLNPAHRKNAKLSIDFTEFPSVSALNLLFI